MPADAHLLTLLVVAGATAGALVGLRVLVAVGARRARRRTEQVVRDLS